MGVTPLVFETSASTYSAIWAFAFAKLDYICDLCKFFGVKNLIFFLTVLYCIVNQVDMIGAFIG